MSDETKIRAVNSALTALGQAYRGDWHDFDGRTLRSQLQELAEVYGKAARGEEIKADVAGFYALNGICPRCRGWTEHCNCHDLVGEPNDKLPERYCRCTSIIGLADPYCQIHGRQQRQDSLTAQMQSVVRWANEHGCYDAADWIKARFGRPS